MRKFEEVKEEFKRFPNVIVPLPTRADSMSAGYDFYSKEDFIIMPGEFHMTWTDVKVKMYRDNVLQVYTRSGNGVKHGIILKNNVGIIDASYYGNENNDGNIGVGLLNTGTEPFRVCIGDRIAQGVFVKYLITADDEYLDNSSESKRIGGFGSTGKN